MKNNYFCGLLIFIVICIIECGSRSYYDILGVKKDSTTAEIKKAFRNMALKFHPDKIKPADRDENTEAKFREIVTAYEVLADEDKRRAYDQHGQTHFNDGGKSSGGGQDFHYDDFFKKFDEAFKNHQEQHRNAHQRAHENAQRAHREHMKFHHGFNFDFDDLFSDNDFFAGLHGSGDGVDLDAYGSSFFSETINTASNGQTCKTVKKKQGNTVTTHTVCH